MDGDALRILDANLNRAREALRVLEDHARLGLGDEALSRRAKQLRHDLAAAARAFGQEALLGARDTGGDVGTALTSEAERVRRCGEDVAAAAAKRAGESLRCIEEYGKLVDSAAAEGVKRLRYALYALEQDVMLRGPRRRRLQEARLHVLITESLCRGQWLDVAGQALAGGADVLQLREKSLADGELLARAKVLRGLTARHGALLFINDRADIARLSGADGVHLGQTDLPVEPARRIGGPALLVGKSTHSVEEARAALAEGADYLAAGPMFASSTKPDAEVRGARLLARVAEMSSVPVVAIGGIDGVNAGGLVAEARRRGGPAVQIAVCQSVISAADPAAAAAGLVAAWERAGGNSRRGSQPAAGAGPIE